MSGEILESGDREGSNEANRDHPIVRKRPTMYLPNKPLVALTFMALTNNFCPSTKPQVRLSGPENTHLDQAFPVTTKTRFSVWARKRAP